MRRLLNATLAAFLCAAPAAAQSLHLQHAVLLMRHGVRPPTKEPALSPALAPSPWPSWDVAPGYLTAHGAAAIKLLGAYDRGMFAKLASGACPDVTIYADVDERTVKTGEAYAAGFAPHCALAVGHAATPHDPLFSPLVTGTPLDSDAVKAQMLAAAGGDADAPVRAHQALFNEMQEILAPHGTSFLDLQGDITITAPGQMPRLKGTLSEGSSAAEDFLLEYLDGKPMSQVAWGRANAAQVAALLEMHPLAYTVTARPMGIAAVTAAPLAHRILEGLTGGTKLTVLVGHDTNQADLGGLLDLHWAPSGYPADDIPPGGGIIFSLLADAAGHQYVTATYQVQSMAQIRDLTPLTKAHGPELQPLAIPGCGNSTKATACTLAAFTKLVDAH
ncbi:MAG TPA: histidine-type phosphatase [Acidocella sp.]|nr:histidine-type phosphatase [Acidocella sp.]